MQLRQRIEQQRLGRRVVSPCVLRRWHAARFDKEYRMSNRFGGPELVGAFRGGRCRALARGDELRVRAPGSSRPRVDPASRSAVRRVRPRSRIHPRIRPRGAGERRTVHAWRDLGGNGVRGVGRSCARVGIDGDDQPGQSRANAGGASRPTRWSPTSSPPTSMRSRRTRAAAAGPGTRARQAGCIALSWSRCSGLNLEGNRLRLAPCLPPAWNEFAMRYRYRETYLPHRRYRRIEVDGD